MRPVPAVSMHQLKGIEFSEWLRIRMHISDHRTTDIDLKVDQVILR